MRIASLHRYPVKGLSPEPLTRAVLTAGGYFPGDRLFAIENGPSGFDAADPQHQPKIKFLMLMRNEGLARLRTTYDDATATLVVRDGTSECVRGRLDTAEGREAVADWFARTFASEMRGTAQVLCAPEGFRFTDSPHGHVSLINAASVSDLECRIGAPVDPLRFRGNILVEDLAAWAEHDWPAGLIVEAAGGVRFEVVKPIERCAATNVDPVTGMRDMTIPRTLMQAYGHVDCGVYLKVLDGGAIAVGERMRLAAAGQAHALELGLR